jgi:flagellar basal-body rod protein FlgB
MDGRQIDLFGLAEKRLAWAQHRQELLAQNIANASTPGWKARDLKPFAAILAGQTVQLAPVRTDPGHMALHAPDPAAVTLRGERAPDGNTIKLDEQLTRVAETETTHTMVANVYAKYMGFFRLALGR